MSALSAKPWVMQQPLAVGASADQMTGNGGDIKRSQVGVTKGAVGRAVTGDRMGFQDAAIGAKT